MLLWVSTTLTLPLVMPRVGRQHADCPQKPSVTRFLAQTNLPTHTDCTFVELSFSGPST
jgi:hypothetical protein